MVVVHVDMKVARGSFDTVSELPCGSVNVESVVSSGGVLSA